MEIEFRESVPRTTTPDVKWSLSEAEMTLCVYYRGESVAR